MPEALPSSHQPLSKSIGGDVVRFAMKTRLAKGMLHSAPVVQALLLRCCRNVQ